MAGDQVKNGATRRLNIFMILLLIYLLIVALAFVWPFIESSESGGLISLPTAAEKAPSLAHPFGLDDLGRDVMANVLSGFRTSFVSGLMATLPFLLAGLFFGIITGFEESALAGLVGGLTNGLNSIPKFFALFLIFAVMGKYLPFYLMIGLGLLSAPRLAEVLKFKISHYRKEDFYDAGIALGLSPSAVVGKHIIWYNTRKSIFSELAYMFGYAVLSEATLSFILHGSMGRDWQSWGDIISQELSGFSGLIYALFNPSMGGFADNNPLKFLAPLAALIFTVMIFSMLSRKLSEER